MTRASGDGSEAPARPTKRQAALMRECAEPIAGRELARRYATTTRRSIGYGTLYVELGRMRERGWVETVDRDENDRRVRIVRITDKGREALAP